MTTDELAKEQRDGTRHALSALLERCGRRYVNAANLLGIQGPGIERIRSSHWEGGTDLSLLLEAWEIICQRYREECYDPQPDLFEDHRERESKRFWQFVHWELYPTLLRENEFVRNVLRAARLLPCRSPKEAGDALLHHVSEMALPDQAPPGDDEEDAD